MKKTLFIVIFIASVFTTKAQTDSLPQADIGPLFFNIDLSEQYDKWIAELNQQKENFSDTTIDSENVRAALVIKNFNPYLKYTNSIVHGHLIVGIYTDETKKRVQYIAVRLKTKAGTTKEQARDAYNRICSEMYPLFKHTLTGKSKKFTIKHFVNTWPPPEITPFEVGYGYDKKQKAWYVVVAIKKQMP
jgi:hypothetical protein